MVVLIARLTNLKLKYKDKHLYDQMLVAYKLEIAKLIFERKLPQDQEVPLINFLFYYVNFEIKETNITFEREIILLTDKTIKIMTMQEAILEETKFEGIEEGRQQTREEVVLRMLKMNLGSDDQIVEVAKVTPGFVRKLRKKVGKITS